MRTTSLLAALAAWMGGMAVADEPAALRLWPGDAPGAVGSQPADIPTLTPWLPPADKAVGTAVVVCPGGGYQNLALDHEGRQIAEWLNRRGVAAFVLRYRLAPRYRHPAPTQDVLRALRLVRTQASQYGVRPERIGVWGFSAGGHLAATAATHFDERPADGDAIDKADARPDFAILAYPVISMDEGVTHGGSRRNLLGENPDPQLAKFMSQDLQVTRRTPPTFLFHTAEDKPVPVENSLRFFAALQKAGVPSELHVYEAGQHGVGLASADPVLRTWADRLQDWLQRRGVLTR